MLERLESENARKRCNEKTAAHFGCRSFLLWVGRRRIEFSRQLDGSGNTIGTHCPHTSLGSRVWLEPNGDCFSPSLNLLLYGLAAPAGGWLIDRIGPRRVILGSLAAIAA